ncbi:MAG: PSD1 domain-containing protein, partial [Planctomycetaceae bacterium]|nr:PSD1 domain-containing protein [Planctomycetaceae bacterium]
QGKERGGLVLDERAAILTGGDSGPAAVPGDVDKSLLVEAIRYSPDGLQMPPTGKLPQAELDTLVEWVKRGLPHPSAAETHAARKGVDLAAGKRHWAFQPLAEQPLPANITPGPGYNRIDFFLEAKRREHGLSASPPADARVLERRATFDLWGLPPGEKLKAESRKQEARDSAAFSSQLSALLASPHYGERWARYWLDLARYADVTESWRTGDGEPWRYRDWVVQALNDDMPYHEFVVRQLAADLLPGAQPTDNAALGFLGLSPTYWKELKLDHQVIKQVVADEWEERLDALGSTFLGLTIGCARCHDHKFDPVTTQDYYALAGVLASIRETERPMFPAEMVAAVNSARAQVKALEASLKPLVDKKPPVDTDQPEIVKLRAKIAELKQTPHYDLPIAFAVVDAAVHVLPNGKSATKIDFRPNESQDLAMQIRGNPARTGAVVPRRFLAVLAKDSQQTFRQGSGRLELARALVDDAGALSARVIVNRVWKHHFGRGIVETPSNFGLQGAAPTHRELLDDLAARFVAHGWSLKWLHREIMSSAAYQQASFRDPAKFAIDPENVWLWRFTPRRLDVESWRDAMLSVSGELDESVGGPPSELADANNRRRTIYGLVRRSEISELLRLYDFPDPVGHSAQRVPTTTPLQQLFVLNSPFFDQQSRKLLARVMSDAPQEAERYEVLYRRLYGRSVRDNERQLGMQFVNGVRSMGATEAEAWRQYIHVLLASNEFLFID